jgi:hypothetical protein
MQYVRSLNREDSGMHGKNAGWFEHSLGGASLPHTTFLEASIVTEGASIIFELHNNKAVRSTNRDLLLFQVNIHDFYNYSVVSDSFCPSPLAIEPIFFSTG